jgi:hypothetical protein
MFLGGVKTGKVHSLGYSYTEMAELEFSLTNDIREAHKKIYSLKLKELLEEVK